MLVLGLDPGLAITGYGLVRESPSGQLELVTYGAITTPAWEPLPKRLLRIDRELGSLIIEYGPDVVAVEELFFCKNVTTALIVGQARGVSILAAAGLFVFLYRTRPGRYIRAVTNNRMAAEMVGVPSNQILALSFGVGAMLAAIAGGLISTFFPFNILAGANYQLKSFVVCVLGGLGSPFGALIGGLILGMLEGVIPIFMETSWVPVFEFSLFVLIMIVRPSGLFGARR